MALNLIKLSSEGRAYDHTRPWNEEELAALLALESIVDDLGEPKLSRKIAADYVRNGITTTELYEKAVQSGFVTKNLDELRQAGVEAHLQTVKADLAKVEIPDSEGGEPVASDESAESTEDVTESDASDAPEEELTREELEAKAKELGINVTKNMKDETISERIAAAVATND